MVPNVVTVADIYQDIGFLWNYYASLLAAQHLEMYSMQFAGLLGAIVLVACAYLVGRGRRERMRNQRTVLLVTDALVDMIEELYAEGTISRKERNDMYRSLANVTGLLNLVSRSQASKIVKGKIKARLAEYKNGSTKPAPLPDATNVVPITQAKEDRSERMKKLEGMMKSLEKKA